MPNYTRLAATATRLITAAGVPVTLQKAVTDDYDPNEGSADPLGSKSFPGAAVRDGATAGQSFQQTMPAGTQVLVERVKLFMTMPTAVPVVGDTLLMDAKTWRIEGCTPIAPGPITLLYEVAAVTP